MALVSKRAYDEETRRLMPPPPPRAPTVAAPKAPEVLDEDTYTSTLEAIIERDYYPELPKMANQLEWLQAVNSGDPRLIQRAQRNIARRRAGLSTPATAATPGTALCTPGTGAHGWGTPGTALLRTPAMTPMVGAGPDATPGPGAGAGADAGAAAAQLAALAAAAPAAAPGLSLDGFLAQYTSEDNASFQAILAEDNRRKRAKVAHHLHRPALEGGAAAQRALLEGPPDGQRPTDEFGSSGQAPMTLLPAPEAPVNALFYDSSQRPSVPPSAKEAAELALGPPKTINRAGTRLRPEQAPEEQEGEEGVRGAALLPHGAPVPGGAEGTVGYSPMATPNLLDQLGTPIMTWGDIAGTPLRLDAADMPVQLDPDAFSGMQFTVQEQPQREAAAHHLAAAKAGGSHVSSLARAGRARGTTPLVEALRRSQQRAAGGGTPLVALSPAARHLAARIKASTPLGAGVASTGSVGRRARGPGSGPTGCLPAAAGASPALGLGLDKALRASYRGAATPTPGRSAAPGASAQKSNVVQARAPRPPAAATGSASAASARPSGPDAAKPPAAAAAAVQGVAAAGSSVTDDLLHL